MIGIDVQARRKTAVVASTEPKSYLVLGDFGGTSDGPRIIDRDILDGVLASFEVAVAGVAIQELEDFHPDCLYKQKIFDDLREDAPAASRTPSPSAAPQAPDVESLLKPSGLLERIVEGGDSPLRQDDPLRQYVRELARAGASPEKPSDSSRDTARCERMRGLLHNPAFQAIEAAWRGIDFVAHRMDEQSTRLHIAQFSRAELIPDLAEAADLKRTRLYALLHARKWDGVFGLYRFEPADVELLGRIALLAGNAEIPFVAEASPDLVSPEIAGHWEELRSMPEAGYLGLALPRFLLRLPYGAQTNAVESFEFEEMPGSPAHNGFLWGNPALACLALAAGAEELENLPLHSYEEDGEWKITPCAETFMTADQVEALIDLGVIPLVSFKDSARVRVAGMRAINGRALAF